MSTATPVVYSPAEVATVLGISRGKVYDLFATGELASVKVGRLRRVRAEALAAYLDRLETAATA